MNATATEVRYHPEDLLDMSDGHRYELIDGCLTERNMGAESSRIAQLINQRIGPFAESNQLGLVWGPDCGYQIFEDDPNRVRYPDGSFIRKGRLPGDQPPKGHVGIPPDLAVEVVSPNDLAWMVEQKVDDFLQAGARLVWVVYPDTQHILVYRPRGEVTQLGIEDELRGEDVLPGFSCPVRELFPTV